MEEWVDVKDRLPNVGQRVRAIIVKELVYAGESTPESANWSDDSKGELGIYCWNPTLRTTHRCNSSISKEKSD